MNPHTPSPNITTLVAYLTLANHSAFGSRHSDSEPVVALLRRRTASSKDTAKAAHLAQTKMEMPKSAVI